MSKNKTNIYDSNEKSMESIIEVAQNTLKEMGMAIKTQFLDKTLVEVIGDGAEGSPLKKNIVTIYHEDNQIYVKLKAQMPDPNQFWKLFEQNIDVYSASSEQIEMKARVVSQIKGEIVELGLKSIVEDEIWDFIMNFEIQFKRLPKDDEIKSIALGYVKMKKDAGVNIEEQASEDSVFVGEKESVKEALPGDITVTPTEALKEMIKEMETLTTDDKKFFIGLFPDLTLDEQKKLVTKIKSMESDLDKIPYLSMDERASLRKEVMNLPVDKRRAKILKVIEKHRKDPKYANQSMEGEIRKVMEQFDFLSDLEKDIYIGMMDSLDLEQKKNFLKRIKVVEESLQKIVDEGIALSDIDKRAYRDELLRVDKAEREKRIQEILEERKFTKAKNELIETIPSMQFEDNEKVVKELMWLSDDERRARIKKLQGNLNDETKKKTKVFEDSKAGSTCSQCGWPIGSFSKKCPRCGKVFGFQI
jgi:hypothetical protein